jgi:hypothetical protein
MTPLMAADDEQREAQRPRRRPASGVETTRQATRQPDESAIDPDLCRCGSCDSLLVQPLDWSLVGRSHWRVTLGCPNCGWTGTGVFAQETVDRYDRELDRGTRKLTSILNRVSRACMQAEVDRFVAALEQDLIVPFDF